MIGQKIKLKSDDYEFIKIIAGPNRPNANVYLCKNNQGQTFIAKHFYNHHPMADIGRNRYNHYGRRRDGSNRVFNEIKSNNSQFPFLVKHIDRVKYQGKWIIIQEYVEGVTLTEYIKSNYSKNPVNVLLAIENFAKELKNWHDNQFAHGDPHLDNVIIENKTMNIKLIDYCQIHHPSFHYCIKYDCYNSDKNKRIKQDLHASSSKLGKGFRQGLLELDSLLHTNYEFINQFDKNYI
ncbi:hypothetical protein EIB71_02425 [Kaistella daneshvariae]|uniref:Protein kinase domain-containing protein n=1 Tax=Kaistella daneshvariae TaxID=2487074 RepID=A0ABN5SWI7_9FLAO|nr:lipopolysaccharide core heptose(II) kinase RfaY [Kaistella daneshvariae]AZI66604.1 hypothetical protein EIB71_02425 [Kaistella daneshvariae]